MKTLLRLQTVFSFFFLCGASYAQTPTPYFCGFDNATQMNGWTVFRKATQAPSVWQVVNQAPYTPTACLAHPYPVSNVVQDWYVSPPFQFPAGGKVDSVRFAFSGFSPQPGVDDTVAIFLLQGSPDPSLATKIQLVDFRGPNYVSDDVWRDTTNLNIPASTQTCYVAFKYKGYQYWLDVRFDNLAISAVQPAPTSNFSFTPNVFCAPRTIVFTDLSLNNPTSWNWQFQGGTPATSTVKNPTVTFNNTPLGTHSVTLVASNATGPGSTASKTFMVSDCTGLEEGTTEENAIHVFPNPSNGKFTILLTSTEQASILVLDVFGRTIMEKKIEASGSAFLDLSGQPAGVYFIRNKRGQAAVKLIRE